ncbi:ERAP1-like C-terminal domain-containing protein [Shewanella loihica]|uniref:Peptidase M1, membrane alanine aminopeptidase n=1 Tax=Shewanella loihica (strain ATCC BAA-1088 / PV-4) TaxID=323850 RepID=A3QB59_SHELP|nr:ERAP1-like C-terminal domain-containing protein [Shewanella loihica]ABO22707.1 peptidase M1, membrane alanine aminopeptidase [Shewanella loihica PV-4]
MRLFSLCASLLLCLLIGACQSTSPGSNQRSEKSLGISASVAKQRASRVSQVSYQLHLDLTQARRFKGEAQIQFQLADTQQALSLDLEQALISQLVINGQKLYPNYDGHTLVIPASLLQGGANLIKVDFSSPYSHEDQGLIEFIDPKDGLRYLYSHFLPSSAQTLAPQFDQPDLRASYRLSVLAPSDWQVASAAKVQSHQPMGESHQALDESRQTVGENHQPAGENSLWQFMQSEPVSPHNFSLLAGPYQTWQSEAEGIALLLFARQSQAESIDAETWLSQTQQALSHYQQRLGSKYPFGHYTQAIVPHLPSEFRASQAQTAFDERNLPQGTPRREILRALAEQWLGNLVTLKWWDQLWLNQSLAYLVADDGEAQLFGQTQADEQQSFIRSPEQVEQQIANSLELFSQDPLPSQNKAIAQLNQLKFMLGDTNFYQGIGNYLERFALQNADLNDFISSLEQVTKQPLSQWSQAAFKRAGVTRLEAEFSCAGDRISRFDLKQHNGDLASTQRVKLGLFTLGRHGLHKNLVSEVNYQGASTEVKRLKGVRCPDLVFSNYQNKAYVRVKLDKASLETALLHLGSLEESDLRRMLWQSLWESVLAGELPLPRFIGSTLVNLPAETDPQVLVSAQDQLKQAKALLEQMSPNQQRYSRQALNAIAQMSLRLTISNKADPALQSLWFDNYLHFAVSHQAKSHLAALLDERESLPGITLTPERRWQIITHLNRYDYPGSERLLLKEKQKDTSPEGQAAALGALVARPSAKEKRQWFERIQAHSKESDPQLLEKLTQVMRHLYPSEQKAPSQASAEQRLAELAEVDKRNSQAFMQSYTANLLPRSCSYASLLRLQALLDKPEGYSPTTLRGINRTIAAEQECIRVQEAMQPNP